MNDTITEVSVAAPKKKRGRQPSGVVKKFWAKRLTEKEVA